MKITILETILILSSSDLNESILIVKESNVFKTLSDVKKLINKPDDVYKFIEKNKSKIDSVKSKSNSKVKKLFYSCVDKLNVGLAKGKDFIKDNWGKVLFLVSIISLGIFAYDQFKDKFDLISKWFNKKTGITDVSDNDDVLKRLLGKQKNNNYTDKSVSYGSKYNSGMTTNDYLKSFYGDKAPEIEKNAVKKRFKGRDVPVGARSFNTTIRTDEEPRSEYIASDNDPFTNIKKNNGRPHANWYSTGGNSFTVTDNSKWGSISDLIDHEAGHIFAKVKAGGNKNSVVSHPDLAKNTAIGYTQANDNELGTALGSIRRYVYRNTNGKVDIANPDDFKKVLQNPKKYKLGDDGHTLHYIKDINNLLNYKGSDPVIIKRRDLLKKRFEDPEYLGLFVDNSKHKNKNIT